MKKKSKTTAANKADKTSEPTGPAASPKPVRQAKPSGHPKSSDAARLKEIVESIIARNGDEAVAFFYDSEDGKFNVGGVSAKSTKELKGACGRVPNGLYVPKALSDYFQGKGIKEVSPQTIYDWMRAHETRESLGGKGTAPKASISFYVAVSRDGIPLEKRREYLEQAIKEKLSVGELKDRVNGRRGMDGDAGQGDSANGRAIPDIATLERTLSESQSLLSGKYEEFCATNPKENSWTIARLENLAIYVWQLRDDIANGGAKRGADE